MKIIRTGIPGFIPKLHHSQRMLDALPGILDSDIYVLIKLEKQIELARVSMMH